MSSPPKKSDAAKVGCGCCLFAVVIPALGLSVLLLAILNAPGTPTGTAPPGATAGTPGCPIHGSAAAVNPIHSQLAPLAQPVKEDGVAAAVLFDTSGSMAHYVPSGPAGDGGAAKTAPKFEIARQAARDVVRRFDGFARRNPGKTVRLGIYEFSSRQREEPCRTVVPLGPPDIAAVDQAVQQMVPRGGTPIGNAMIAAYRDLGASGLRRLHLLVITDGMNNVGYAPVDVAQAMSQLPEDRRPAIYFVAFDTEAERFEGVKQAGGLVLSAAGGPQLNETIEYILSGKILAEQFDATGKAKR